MGLDDKELSASVVAKHRRAEEGTVELGKCVEDLHVLADLEWDSMLDDLQEMGFEDRSLNKKLLAEAAGSLKQAVKRLVRHPQELD